MAKETVSLPRVTRGHRDDPAIMVRANSYNEEAHTIDVIWTTGATVRRSTWQDGLIDEELVVSPNAIRLDRLNSGAPFLDSHDAYSLDAVLGSVVRGSARIVKGQGVATIMLSRAEKDAANVEKIRSGIISNVSVGYRIHRVEKVEGPDVTVPIWRVVDWEPLEISAVAVGADPAAQVRSAEGDPRFPVLVETREHAASIAAATRMRMRQAEIDARLRGL